MSFYKLVRYTSECVGGFNKMVWQIQQGGPWGGGGNQQGPWGGGSSGGPRPPDIEEVLRRGQDRFKKLFPGSGGGG